jgi:hypothetical protein
MTETDFSCARSVMQDQHRVNERMKHESGYAVRDVTIFHAFLSTQTVLLCAATDSCDRP